jgi:hypothetical protein
MVGNYANTHRSASLCSEIIVLCNPKSFTWSSAIVSSCSIKLANVTVQRSERASARSRSMLFELILRFRSQSVGVPKSETDKEEVEYRLERAKDGIPLAYMKI